jgi:hypothetical protein
MNNPPAFPTTKPLNSWDDPNQGMTLRDYFAAQAMTGAQVWDAVLNGKEAQFAQENGAEMLVTIAYAVADAMLRARQTTKGDTNV